MFSRSITGLILTAFIFAASMGCDKPLPEPIAPETPYAFSPLKIGNYWEYAVDSIIYHETTGNDTTLWFVREELIDTFYNLNGDLNYVIDRYRRKTDVDAWQLTNTWSVMQVDGKMIRNENNLRFVKLVSPPLNDVQWDGNVYLGGLDDLPYDEECNRLIYYEGWDYIYSNVNENYSIPDFDFENTITVEQFGDSNLIWFDYAKEIYALDVGMVEKTFKHYYTQDITCPDCPWEQRVQCGFSVYMRLTGYQL